MHIEMFTSMQKNVPQTLGVLIILPGPEGQL